MTANCIDCGTIVADATGTFVVCDDCYERFYKNRKYPFVYCGDVAKKKTSMKSKILAQINRWIGR